ncbi:hypothetical protein Pyn_20184 [Prunus yedoensis var. nudiflora]|uniref:Protein IDA-LIKE 2 n=3 Tax=Prunus TaxID=3754 RepID=A0A6J5Y0H9_PRUAR|nr:hypothetical protein GBA52_026476 [Prunus armeniaca]ONH89926.1 hypothetical protein PRUPE_8G024400 [Prunus persica]PQQ07591.1 hypothetical protein Pyn_20184 [Prunus yedoensis var. nudiflora]CAB4289308.1 unnamed protein product [Prunus armeniaca]CAB4319630.1 unnamed protein product [Prunus armeniaca]
MGKRHDHQILLVVALRLLLLLIFLVGHTQSSRTLQSQVFKVMKPNSDHNPHEGSFFAFLPKASPIPPSGPSKEHNGVGLQSSSQLSP